MCPSECGSVPPLTNSLLIEYLARITIDHPYVGLMGGHLNLHWKEGSNDGSPASGSRPRNMGVTVLPLPFLSTKSSLQESYLTNVSLYSSSSHRCNAQFNANACCNPSKAGALDVGDDYVLNRLSTQVEVEHLRNKVNSVFRRSSRSLSAPCSISGFTSRDPPRAAAPSTTRDTVDGDQEVLSPPLDSTLNATTSGPMPNARSSFATDKNPYHNSDCMTRRISRLEHNIIAPMSF
ncbi:unnamed protein product [Taenia asiatica]|uniref:Uncharacterized protein n=1 Tax=Taenia asiatica TaxID=60517 RepID=A0A0R3W2A5_TAEAS|nr:unnamed protein product [Taenia asiatica]